VVVLKTIEISMTQQFANAVKQSHPLDEIREMVQKNPELVEEWINFPVLGRCTCLHIAIMTQNLPLIQFLIETNGLKLLEIPAHSSGQTPLHCALELFSIPNEIDKKESIIKALLDTKIDLSSIINMADTQGLTPLHAGTLSDAPVHVIELLIHRGANMQTRVESTNQNALHLCAIRDGHQLAEFYLTQIAKQAVLHAHEKDLELNDLISLLDKDNNGYTPLHIAAKIGSTKMCLLFITFQREEERKLIEIVPTSDFTHQLLSSQSNDGHTAYILAQQEGHEDCLSLLDHGLDQWLVVEKETVVDEPIKSRYSFMTPLLDRFKTSSWSPWAVKKSPSKTTLTHYDLEQQSIFDYVKNLGYTIEKHETMTSDGYVLQIFRIGQENDHSNVQKPVVFLQHGVCNSGSTWIVTGAKQGLAFLLARAGYDVWLGNNRGVQFARKHIKYSDSHATFWKWSWQDMARHDFVAQINYVLDITKVPNLSYVGHSQGTTQAFAALCMYPFMQSKVFYNIMMIYNNRSIYLWHWHRLHGYHINLVNY
jgi:ankyrin repeat protein